MPSTFFGLNIASSGLSAYQVALNTTANNIANVQTTGYSRQQSNRVASDALLVHQQYGAVGTGVTTVSVKQIRNQYYDTKYWYNQSSVGLYETKLSYLQQIENYFIDDSSSKGFTTILNTMFNSLDTLKNNASDVNTRQQFIGSAQNLATYFNSVSEGLTDIQKGTNDEIKSTVQNINAIAEKIAVLNKQINVIEIQGGYANELRDQRALLIDELSEIVPTEVSEVPITDTNHPDEPTGANYYTVKIGGQVLVDTYNYETLECKARDYKVNQTDAAGLYDIKWSKTGNTFNAGGSSMSGTLKALFDIRDGNNGECFKGTVSEISKNQTSGKNEVTIDVSASYLKDLNKSTLPDKGGVIQIGNQEYYYDTFKAVYGADGKIEKYVFEISDDLNKNSRQPADDRIGKEAQIGVSIDYQGVPYYQQQLNEWVRTYAQAFNKILTGQDAVDGYGNAADILFVANEATDVTQRKFVTSRNQTPGATVSSTDDTYYYLTATNFAINKEMLDDPQLLATHTGAGTGPEGYDLVKDLIDLQTNKDKMSFRGCSARDFLQCVLSDVSLNASSANTFSASYQNIAKTIDTQRLSVSGVDTEEESLNLVQYQRAYNLASQMIQVLTEVYDRLILQTGV